MLLEHNVNVYNTLEQTLTDNNCCCVVMGTGCGKTYVASEYLNNNNFKALVVSPRRSICESWEKHTDRVDTITYQKLSNIYKDIDYSKYDVVICDEVHHIGAPTWGEPIKHLIDNKIIKVIGLTESSIRYTDGGKDVAEDFFYGNVAFGETVSSAIEKKILNPVTYVGAMFNSDGLKKTLRGKIQSRLYAKLNLILNNTPTVTEILKKHMPAGKRKGIIFASTIEDIQSAIDFVKSVYPNVETRFVHSKQPQSYNDAAFDWFKNTDEGYICSVDMISEGVHIKGVNTIIMLRRTESVNLFNQQIGRCLNASSKEPAIIFDLVNNKYSIRIIHDKFKIKTNSIFDGGKLNVVPSEQLIVNDYTKDIVDVLKEIKLSLEGRWTEYEDNLLKEFYKEHPDGKGLKKFASENFKNRTLSAVRHRANDLELNTVYDYKPFSKEEDDLLRTYYPKEGVNCYVRFTNRTKHAIYIRALKLNLNRDDYFWTEEEMEIVRKYYPIEGQNVVKRLSGRSLPSVKHIVKRMGITSNSYWTDEEDEIIKANYLKMSANKLEELLPNRTADGIRKRASELGISKIKKIMCIETGQVFNNAKEAAQFMNFPNVNANVNIIACCRKKKKSAYKYHWKYAEEEN